MIWDAGKHGKQGDIVGHVQKGNEVRRLEDKTDLVAPQRTQIADLPSIVIDQLVTKGHPPTARVDDRPQSFE